MRCRTCIAVASKPTEDCISSMLDATKSQPEQMRFASIFVSHDAARLCTAEEWTSGHRMFCCYLYALDSLGLGF